MRKRRGSFGRRRRPSRTRRYVKLSRGGYRL